MDKKNVSQLLFIIVGSVLVLVVAQLIIRMGFMGLLLLFTGLLVVGLYFGFQMLLNHWKQKAYANSTEGQFKEKIALCQQELDKHNHAYQVIQESIEEIQDRLKQAKNINPQIEQDSNALLAKFQNELELRKSKINFFQTCIEKLESLLHNHLIAKELIIKEEKLRKLQEDHYQEIGKMEEIKSSMELDTFYLETIQDLSHKIEHTMDLSNTKSINDELVKMTQDIERLLPGD